MSEEDVRSAAAFGLRPEDYAEEYRDVEVWPDNWKAVKLFHALGTQWRTGFGGLTGLDYTAVRNAFVLMGVPRKEWPEMFEMIQLMEDEALQTVHG